MKNYKLVLFDLDGTLYHKKKIALKLVLCSVWNALKLYKNQKVRRSLRGCSFENSEEYYDVYMRKLAEAFGCSTEKSKKWYFETYLPLLIFVVTKLHKRREKIEELVMTFKKEGARVCVYSDYPVIEERLSGLKIDKGVFDGFYSAEGLGGLKPAKVLIERLLEKEGVEGGEVLFIGDRDDTDGESARSVGAHYIRIVDKEEDVDREREVVLWHDLFNLQKSL